MPTSTLTYKNNSHKSKKRSKYVSKKHKNSKRKHYSNKKNNMRGGSRRMDNSFKQKFTNPYYSSIKKEHDDYIIKVKEELKDLTSEPFPHLFSKIPIQSVYANRIVYGNVSKPNLFYDEKLPEIKEKMRNDFKNNKLDTFRRILQLGEDFMELSTKQNAALKSYEACRQSFRYQSEHKINYILCEKEKTTYNELQTQRKRMKHIFRQFGLGGFLSKSTPEELQESQTIFNKIVSSINDDNIIIYKMSQKNDEPNPIGNSNNEIF